MCLQIPILVTALSISFSDVNPKFIVSSTVSNSTSDSDVNYDKFNRKNVSELFQHARSNLERDAHERTLWLNNGGSSDWCGRLSYHTKQRFHRKMQSSWPLEYKIPWWNSQRQCVSYIEQQRTSKRGDIKRVPSKYTSSDNYTTYDVNPPLHLHQSLRLRDKQKSTWD